MSQSPPPWAELLAYLGEMGYGDLYLGRPAAPAGAVASAATELRTGAASAPAPRSDRPSAPPPPVPQARPLPPVAPAAVGEEAATRAAQLLEVATAAAGCTRCRLCEGRNKVVFGSGDPNTDLMFIGEGPGAEEDKQGLPFVGRAGELLTRIIQAIDRTRDDVYIANIVKCRPPGNRDPQPDEVAACRPYLERQIALVQPKVLVALGRIAAQTLLGNDSPIGRMRGRWFQVYGIPTMVTYHPAALLRNPALKRPTWEDMQQVRDRLNTA